jgi:FtsZ-binding cell division protein ZapB
LTQRLAIELMEATPEEKQSAEKLIEELREEIRLLKIENQALTVSRDTFQSENAQMKKQIKMLQKKLKEAGVE